MTALRTHKKSCSTKKGRDALVAEVIALCSKHGLTYSKHSLGPREITFRVHVGHYGCMMFFDADSRTDCFGAHWYTRFVPGWRDRPGYPQDFAGLIWGSVNEITWGKATTFHNDFDSHLNFLEKGIERLKQILVAGGYPLIEREEHDIAPETTSAAA